VVTMFVFGVLASAARHEPEAIAALRRGGRGARPANAVGRLLRIPLPQPYRASGARTPAAAGRVR
jgi:cell division protein FtsW